MIFVIHVNGSPLPWNPDCTVTYFFKHPRNPRQKLNMSIKHGWSTTDLRERIVHIRYNDTITYNATSVIQIKDIEITLENLVIEHSGFPITSDLDYVGLDTPHEVVLFSKALQRLNNDLKIIHLTEVAVDGPHYSQRGFCAFYGLKQ